MGKYQGERGKCRSSNALNDRYPIKSHAPGRAWLVEMERAVLLGDLVEGVVNVGVPKVAAFG